MAAVIGSLRAELSATIAKFQEDMGKAANAVKGFAREFSKIGNDFKRTGAQMQTIGTSMTKTITLPLAALGVGVAKVGMDFESAFAGVRKTVQATEPEFAQMAQGFRDLAKSIPVSVNELARLGEAAGALGIPKAEVVDFARVMALLGVTTNVTSDQAAESIAKIQNIFGAAGQDTERFASTLVALGNDGASTEDQILSMATRIAGAGNVIGLTQGEVLAFASALSSVGLEAEAGGTAISRVFVDMAAAVSKGGDAVAGFAKVAGKSVDEFSRLFKEDAASAVEQFVTGLGRIKDSGGDLLGTLEELGFTEIRVRDTLLRAAGAGDLLTKSLALQKKAWQENTALTKEAEERFKTTANQIALLGNRLKDIGITLFTALKPAIDTAIAGLNSLLPVIDSTAKAFAALPGGVQLGVIGVAAFAAALGPIIFIAGQVVASMGTLILAFGKGGLATKGLLAIFAPGPMVLGLFARALTAVTGPIGWIVGIGAAILTATSTWDEFFRTLKAGGEIIANLVVGAFERFVTVARPVAHAIGAIVGFIDQIYGFTAGIRALGSAFATAMEWIADKAERASAALRGIPFAEFQSSLAKQRTDLKQTTEATNQTADAFTNLKQRLSGALASKDLEALTRVVRELSEEGQLTWPVMRRIATEAGALQAAGASLSPELQNIVSALKTMDTQQPGVSGFAGLTKTLSAARAELAKLSSTDSKALSAAIESGAFSMEELEKKTGLSSAALKIFQDRVKGTGDAFQKANAELVQAQQQVGKLTDAQKTQIISLHNFGLATAKIAAALKISERAVDDFLDAGKALRDSANWVGEQQIKAVEEAATAFKSLQVELSAIEQHGASIRGVFRNLAGDLEKLGEHIEPEQIKAWANEFAFVGPILDDIAEEAKSLGASVERSLERIPDLLIQAFTGGGGLSGALKAIGVMMAESILTPLMAGLSKVQKIAVTAGASLAVALGQSAGMGSAMQAVTGIAVGLGGAAIAATAWGTSMAAAGVAGSVALGAATLGIGAAVVGAYMLYKHFKGVTEAIKEARAAVGEFEAQLHATLTMQQSLEAGGEPWKASIIVVRDAYAQLGLTAQQAEADVAAMWNAAELGPEAAKAAMDKVNAAFVKLREITDAIAGMGIQTQEELQMIADKAKEVFEFMERSGKYTAEQLAIAWEDFARKQAIALGDAAAIGAQSAEAAGFKTREQLEATAQKARETYQYMLDSGLYTYAELDRARQAAAEAEAAAFGTTLAGVDSLAARYKKLSDQVSKEAPEAHIGSVERVARAEMAALEAQMAAEAQKAAERSGLVDQARQEDQAATSDRIDQQVEVARAVEAQGEVQKSVQQQMLDATNRLADAVEGLAGTFGTLAPAAQDAADKITSIFKRVRIKIPVDFTQGRSASAPDGSSVSPPNNFAGGSGGIRDFGIGTPAMLHGREAVVTDDQIANLMEYGAPAPASSQRAGDMIVNVSLTVNGSVLAEEEYVETHLVEPILTGIERNYRPHFERLVRGTR